MEQAGMTPKWSIMVVIRKINTLKDNLERINSKLI